MRRPDDEPLWQLFHEMWGKAAEAPSYLKDDWCRLQRCIEQSHDVRDRIERVKQLKADIRTVRTEMRAKGIRRISCFNAGLDSETYRLNMRMFELETYMKRETETA